MSLLEIYFDYNYLFFDYIRIFFCGMEEILILCILLKVNWEIDYRVYKNFFIFDLFGGIFNLSVFLVFMLMFVDYCSN